MSVPSTETLVVVLLVTSVVLLHSDMSVAGRTQRRIGWPSVPRTRSALTSNDIECPPVSTPPCQPCDLTNVESSLLSLAAAINRISTGFAAIAASGVVDCNIQLRSIGQQAVNENDTATTSIGLNNVERWSMNRTEMLRNEGLYVALLDNRNCRLIPGSIYANETGGYQLMYYLGSLAPGQVVVGVSVGDISLLWEVVYAYMTVNGIPIDSLAPTDTLVFIMKPGYPSLTLYDNADVVLDGRVASLNATQTGFFDYEAYFILS